MSIDSVGLSVSISQQNKLPEVCWWGWYWGTWHQHQDGKSKGSPALQVYHANYQVSLWFQHTPNKWQKNNFSERFLLYQARKRSQIFHLHILIVHLVCPPKILNKYCLQFPCRCTVIPTGNEKQGLCKIEGKGGSKQGTCILFYGRCANGEIVKKFRLL